MQHPSLAVVAGLLIAVPAIAQDRVEAKQPSAVDASNFEAWKTHILPKPEELRWESLPWLTTYTEGLQKASEQAKPLLLWVMNGHPLGCT